MLYWIAVLCLLCYLLCSIWFLCGGSIQLYLLWHARKPLCNFKKPKLSKNVLPVITIQVPVYNERYVITRLLSSLGQLDYPKNLFDIQVLDDSTDDTSEIIIQSVETLRKQGVRINVLQRSVRTGYKAGALQAGLDQCKGDLIAIFDADFIPEPDFLQRMCLHFSNRNVGGVQARWTHQNLYENSLTIIQSFLLDSHFTLEQRGRAKAGYFLNFNGTAGVWRKQCIIDSGGWNSDVLTEDLELSYRAQLRGWKFLYDNQVTVPAELPSDMNAFKVQQFRWAKGMAQTATIHLKEIVQLKAPLAKKLHAAFHLLSSIAFLAIMGNILLMAPILVGRHYFDGFRNLSNLLLYSGITLPVVCTYYYFGTLSTLPRKVFWQYLPLFLVVYLALSIQNSIAVIQGFTGHSSAFIRTPKFSGVTNNIYTKSIWTSRNWFEMITAGYILITAVYSIYVQDYFFLFFLLLTLAGLIILNLPKMPKLRFLFRNASAPAKRAWYKRTAI